MHLKMSSAKWWQFFLGLSQCVKVCCPYNCCVVCHPLILHFTGLHPEPTSVEYNLPDTRYFAFCNLSPPRMFLPIGPLYVTSRYSTMIFYRGVSYFTTVCPCGVWCRGLTTCLLYVGPLFGNRLLSNSWFDIIDCKSYFFVFWHVQLYMS